MIQTLHNPNRHPYTPIGNGTTLWRVAPLLMLCFVLLTPSTTHAQAVPKMREDYKEYVRTYAIESIRQMDEYKIPASITLAQGLLESAAGKSRLATKGNNHFGIKCHRAWQGKTIHANDDLPNECFRRYDSAADSYRDHSRFLQQGRYKRLFTYKLTDYRRWARGLQDCGYATSKAYANSLIRLIELYELYAFDRGEFPSWMTKQETKELAKVSHKKKSSHEKETVKATHEGYMSYGLHYVLANSGDTFTSIAEELGMNPKKIAKNNDAPIDFPLYQGDIVYLDRKNKRADEKFPTHVIQVGESMHSISQHYGIRLDRLYKLNDLDYEYVPIEGDTLKLR